MLEGHGVTQVVVLASLQILLWPLVQACFCELGMIQTFASREVYVHVCPRL